MNLIDWRLVCILLHKHMSYYKIAAACSMQWKHIRDLAAGIVQEPRFNSGIRLLDLAYDVLSEDEFKRLRKR